MSRRWASSARRRGQDEDDAMVVDEGGSNEAGSAEKEPDCLHGGGTSEHEHGGIEGRARGRRHDVDHHRRSLHPTVPSVSSPPFPTPPCSPSAKSQLPSARPSAPVRSPRSSSSSTGGAPSARPPSPPSPLPSPSAAMSVSPLRGGSLLFTSMTTVLKFGCRAHRRAPCDSPPGLCHRHRQG